MKITALDIRQKTFEKSFRGVDKDEVQAFLNTVSQEWERLGDENRDLRSRLEQAQQDVQKMREVETGLYRTLKTAEDTSVAIAAQAQQDADVQRRAAQQQAEAAVAAARQEGATSLQQARHQAAQILTAAQQQAHDHLDAAHAQAQQLVAEMQHVTNELGADFQKLEKEWTALVSDLQHLGAAAADRAEKARTRPVGDAVAILSRAAGVEVQRPELPALPKIASDMFVSAAFPSSSAAVPATASSGSFANVQVAERPDVPRGPQDYNPKPGQQPDPGAPAQAPGPEIERPGAPAENPGIAPAPSIQPPAPSQVPDPAPPRVEPPAPDFQPVGPDRPEISQPVPVTHPGQPSMEKSFFDEI